MCCYGVAALLVERPLAITVVTSSPLAVSVPPKWAQPVAVLVSRDSIAEVKATRCGTAKTEACLKPVPSETARVSLSWGDEEADEATPSPLLSGTYLIAACTVEAASILLTGKPLLKAFMPPA